MEGDELPTLAGEGWNDVKELLTSIRDGPHEIPEELQDPTDLINYVENHLTLQERDLGILNDVIDTEDWEYCDICGKELQARYFVEDYDANNRYDMDTRYEGYALVYCIEHPHKVAFQYRESWFE